jgi:hypothetical protein
LQQPPIRRVGGFERQQAQATGRGSWQPIPPGGRLRVHHDDRVDRAEGDQLGQQPITAHCRAHQPRVDDALQRVAHQRAPIAAQRDALAIQLVDGLELRVGAHDEQHFLLEQRCQHAD